MKRVKQTERCEVIVRDGAGVHLLPVGKAVRTGNGNELHYQLHGDTVGYLTRDWRLAPPRKRPAGPTGRL
jgi:hypothetical protein